MRINNIKTTFETKKNISVSSNNNDFSSTLGKKHRQTSKYYIEKYLKDIKIQGQILINTQKYSDVIKYKNTIKEYLKSVVEDTYRLNKNTSFWEHSYITTVDTINKKLEELTNDIINKEQENINIASTIESIQGLLIDVYK